MTHDEPGPMPAGRTLGPDVCPELRTKTMYLNIAHRRHPDSDGGDNTAIYWCVKTFTALGPDDLPLGPEDCTRARACCTLRPIEV